MKDLSLKDLAFKTVTMVTLLGAQRSRTIYLFSLDNMSVTPELYKLRTIQLIKQTGPGRHQAEIEFAAYPKDPYLSMVTIVTEPLKMKQTAPFISLSGPHKVVSKSTISRWVKTTLQHAGVDMNIFTPQSTCAAYTSNVTSLVYLDTILKTAGWPSDSILRRFYNKPIHKPGEFSLSCATNAH